MGKIIDRRKVNIKDVKRMDELKKLGINIYKKKKINGRLILRTEYSVRKEWLIHQQTFMGVGGRGGITKDDSIIIRGIRD